MIVRSGLVLVLILNRKVRIMQTETIKDTNILQDSKNDALWQEQGLWNIRIETSLVRIDRMVAEYGSFKCGMEQQMRLLEALILRLKAQVRDLDAAVHAAEVSKTNRRSGL